MSQSPRRSLWAKMSEAVRTRLWPLPTIGVGCAFVLGLLLPRLDARVDAQLPAWLDAVVFGGDASAARTVLDAVSSSLITVTSLTFSLTVVTLQLASSQFSPRLLRTFTQDLFVQVTLALFLATFTYSLTVLRSVRSSDESTSPFVPRLAVTTSFLLAVASVIGLVLFLAHLTRQIRVETMLRNVHADATGTIRDLLPPRAASGEDQPSVPSIPHEAEAVFAPGSGFLTSIEEKSLLRAAVDADLVITIAVLPGEFVVAGTPIGATWSQGGRPPPSAVTSLQGRIDRLIHTEVERTAEQDVAYPLRQLVDVVNKALSPGINDPTTAIHALGHIAALLSELAAYRLGPVVLVDDDETPRVILARPTFEQLLDLAITQPRRYGASDPQVQARLYHLLTEIGWHGDVDGRRAVGEQLSRLEATTAGQDFDEIIRRHLNELAVRAHAALDTDQRHLRGFVRDSSVPTRRVTPG